MKVLLINPPVLSVLEPWYDTPDFVRTGLAYIGGYLREKSNYDIKIIDAKFERLNFHQVVAHTVDFQPDIIGFTAFTNEIKPAAYLAYKLKEMLPGIVTIIGGVHVTALPEQTLEEFPAFDIGVVGEGEKTMVNLCAALEKKETLHALNGLVFRESSGAVQRTEPQHRPADLDEIQMPAWDLMPNAPTYFIQSQRGCPFNCSFCMNPGGKAVRHRSIANVINEIEYLIKEKGCKRISFGDEIFTVDRAFTEELLNAMIAHNIGEQIEWDVQTHVRYVDYELFQKFKQARVTIVELGVETGDEELLKKMGKGTNFDMIYAAFKAAKKAGVKAGAFFLFGQPNESEKSLKMTIDVAARINPDVPMFGLMVPYPGTRVSELAVAGESGYHLVSTDWDDYNKQLGGALEFAGIRRKQIEKYQIRGYLTVFLRNLRLWDLAVFSWKYREGAISALTKLFKKGDSMSSMLKKPHDYDAILSSDDKNKMVFLKKSYSKWLEYQKSDLKVQKASSVD